MLRADQVDADADDAFLLQTVEELRRRIALGDGDAAEAVGRPGENVEKVARVRAEEAGLNENSAGETVGIEQRQILFHGRVPVRDVTGGGNPRQRACKDVGMKSIAPCDAKCLACTTPPPLPSLTVFVLQSYRGLHER